MSQKGVTATIDIDGKIEVDVHGVKGSCTKHLSEIAESLSHISEHKDLTFREESRDKDSKVVAQNSQS